MLKLNILLLRNVQKTLYNGLKVKNGFSHVRCIQTNRKASGSAISSAKLAVKGFIVIELGLFLGCYYLWKKMNRSQDFRYYMSKNYPTILDGYYKIGENIGGMDIRSYDLKTWKEENKP